MFKRRLLRMKLIFLMQKINVIVAANHKRLYVIKSFTYYKLKLEERQILHL